MAKGFHSFEFYSEVVNGHKITRVFLDGNELRGVTAADIHYGVDELPVVKLEFLSPYVSGNLAKVEVKNNGTNDSDLSS